MSISSDSLSDETLNQGPWALLLRRQYEFPSWIDIVQFSIFNVSMSCDAKFVCILDTKHGYGTNVMFFFSTKLFNFSYQKIGNLIIIMISNVAYA